MKEFITWLADEKFTDEELSEEGNEFAKYYYEGEPPNDYMSDYHDTLCKELPSSYHVKDTWKSFDKIAPVIEGRYRMWKKHKK